MSTRATQRSLIALTGGVSVALIGISALLGWLLHRKELAGAVAGYIPVAPNTAVCFLLLGGALCAIGVPIPRARAVATTAGGVVLLIAGARLLEYLAGVDLGVDRWLFSAPAEHLGLAPVGRMAFFTSITFLFASLAIVASAVPRTETLAADLARVFGGLSAVTGAIFLLGYAYGSPLLYGSATVPMALPTALGFTLLGISVVTLQFQLAGRARARRQLLLATRSEELEREVGERRRAEMEAVAARKEAEEANRAKSEFLSRMSHELRTPLNSVIGFAGILLRNRDGALQENTLQYLDRIRSNGQHLLGLINDILDLARVESGKMDVHYEQVDVDTLVRETVAQLQGKVLQGDVSIHAEMPAGLAPLRTDPVKLKQIVINLVGNALKFTPSGTVTVRVIAGTARRALRIDVIDTGIGIAPDRLGAIFDAFEQASAKTAAVYGGTGLGLAISRSLADLLDYRIAVSSTEGVGSIFSVLLDRTAEPPSAPAREVRVAPSRRTPSLAMAAISDRQQPAGLPCVLVIEDSVDARRIVTEQLRDLPIRVLCAESGEEGLEMARRDRPAVILLDLVMPTMTGWEVLGRLKSEPELATIPVIVISSETKFNRAAFLGTLDFLEKPVGTDELLSVIGRHLPTERHARVLVVDDDADARRIITDALTETYPCEVTHAADGVDAFERLHAGMMPDLIVLDLVMPRMDGFTFLAALRRDPRYTAMPVVVASSKELSAAERAALASPAMAVVKKGEDIGRVLQDALRSLVGGR